MKYLIINADDFGMSKIFNEVILDLIKKNKVLSTTVMVNRVDKTQDIQIKKLIEISHHVNLSVGLHLEFLKGDYESQIQPQFEKFMEIFNFKPSHIDIHKTHQEAYLLVSDFCKKVNLPCRNHGVLSQGVKATKNKYFKGTGLEFEVIENWIKNLKEGEFSEILFHPGKYDPDCKSSLNKDRERDVKNIIKLNSIWSEPHLPDSKLRDYPSI